MSDDEVIRRYNMMDLRHRALVIKYYAKFRNLNVRETAKHFRISVGQAHKSMRS